MKNFLHNGRQALLVTIVLLLICGLLFPLLLTGLSKVFFPSQAAGSLVTVDGQVVGAKNVGQEFTEDYYLWGRPSAYHYNTYVEQEDGTQTYNDGSEFAGLSSGSNNYAPSNPALTERVEADLETFLEKNPEVKEGCKTCGGLGMLLCQGAEAFRLYSKGLEMPIDEIQALLYD